jgi:mono/diheme cytochrome c family protein
MLAARTAVLVWHGDRLIETRLLLHHQPPHGWKGYSYEWDLAETEATLLTTAKDTAIDGQIWHYPSRAECDACHTAIAGFTLGPEVGQLNRAFTYEATGIEANQLITLESINMLTRPLTDDEKSTALYAIDDTAYSAERRARSYLHVNCANCHQPGGPGGGNIDLRIATPLEHTGICNQAPLGDTLGLMNPVIIAPGEPDQSILLLRMEHPDQHRMPPLASSIVDSEATAVIRSWISDLAKCP